MSCFILVGYPDFFLFFHLIITDWEIITCLMRLTASSLRFTTLLLFWFLGFKAVLFLFSFLSLSLVEQLQLSLFSIGQLRHFAQVEIILRPYPVWYPRVAGTSPPGGDGRVAFPRDRSVWKGRKTVAAGRWHFLLRYYGISILGNLMLMIIRVET